MAIYNIYKGFVKPYQIYNPHMYNIIRAEMPLPFLKYGQRLSYSQYIGSPIFQEMREPL